MPLPLPSGVRLFGRRFHVTRQGEVLVLRCREVPRGDGPGRLYLHRRVLVVDDDPTFAGTLAQLLRQHGLAVARAPDGTSALALAAARRVDLILLDLHLPDRHGFDVLRALQARRPERPVIVITGVEPDRGPEALALGAVAFFTKPPPVSELLAVISRLLAPSSFPFSPSLPNPPPGQEH